jgi:hypothetical protein
MNIVSIRLVKCSWKDTKLWIFVLVVGLIMFRILGEFSNKLKEQILLNLDENLAKHDSTVCLIGIFDVILKNRKDGRTQR